MEERFHAQKVLLTTSGTTALDMAMLLCDIHPGDEVILPSFTFSRTATAAGQPLALTRKETGILEYLLLHRGRPVSQEELLEHVWDNSVDNFSNSIRVHISALRKKLRAALGYDPVRNRIGEGYLIEEEQA